MNLDDLDAMAIGNTAYAVPSAHLLPFIVHGARPGDVDYVALNMRAEDRAEAASFGIEVKQGAPDIVSIAADVYTAYYRDRPTFIFGTVEIVPGVRELFGFGTDDTRRVIPAVTGFTDDYWIPDMFESGVRRIQARVPATHNASLRWLEGFGMFCECIMHDYAVDGVPMHQLAFTTREFRKHVLEQEEIGPRTRGDRAAR